MNAPPFSRRIPRPLWRVSIRRGGEVIRDNHSFEIRAAGKGWWCATGTHPHKSSFLPWTSRGALLPNQPSPPPFCFLLSSSFPSLPLLSRAALLLLLVVVVAARARGVANTARINATRPGWITTTINFIERTISYVAIEPRRERERERTSWIPASSKRTKRQILSLRGAPCRARKWLNPGKLDVYFGKSITGFNDWESYRKFSL